MNCKIRVVDNHWNGTVEWNGGMEWTVTHAQKYPHPHSLVQSLVMNEEGLGNSIDNPICILDSPSVSSPTIQSSPVKLATKSAVCR